MRNSRSGITLIEVLIAVSLLSLLSVGMLYAMRLGFTTMEKTDAHLVQNRKVVNVRQIVENEILGYVPAHAEWHRTPESVFDVQFHQFDASAMRFVTAYSLQDAWRGRTQIAVLQVIPGEANIGVRLIVNELPFTGPVQAGLMVVGLDADPATGFLIARYTPVAAGPQSFVLADKLAYCRFSYLEARLEPPYRVWRTDWVKSDMPLGVRIDMAPLSNSASELHMSTITANFPVSVRTDAGNADGG